MQLLFISSLDSWIERNCEGGEMIIHQETFALLACHEHPINPATATFNKSGIRDRY